MEAQRLRCNCNSAYGSGALDEGPVPKLAGRPLQLGLRVHHDRRRVPEAVFLRRAETGFLLLRPEPLPRRHCRRERASDCRCARGSGLRCHRFLFGQDTEGPPQCAFGSQAEVPSMSAARVKGPTCARTLAQTVAILSAGKALAISGVEAATISAYLPSTKSCTAARAIASDVFSADRAIRVESSKKAPIAQGRRRLVECLTSSRVSPPDRDRRLGGHGLRGNRGASFPEVEPGSTMAMAA